MKNFKVNVSARNLYASNEMIDKSYTVSANNSHDAEMNGLNLFWKDVDMNIFAYVDSTVVETK